MQNILKDVDARMAAAIDTLARELAAVRTGRASAALLEGIRVDYYGTPTPVAQMASVTVPDARTLMVQPWDATQLKALAKERHVSEDEEHRGHDQIQKTTDKYIAKVDELLKKKEQEILTF